VVANDEIMLRGEERLDDCERQSQSQPQSQSRWKQRSLLNVVTHNHVVVIVTGVKIIIFVCVKPTIEAETILFT